MKQILLLLALLPLAGTAQNNKGINFEHGLSWTEILAKAKATNKYIFVDCYTTWCVPCKYMSEFIFPQESVGSFFNSKCINVKVQIDSTGKDNEEVKSRYADARLIAEKYKIDAYPTFLFFTPDGNVVHKIVGGAEHAEAFIKSSADAFDTSTQYYTLLKKVDATPNDPKLLKTVALAANAVYDKPNATKNVNAYLRTQHNLFTKENIEFLKLFTKTSRDTGFIIFLHHPEKVNVVLGPNAAEHRTKEIILNEEIYPKFFDMNAGGAPIENPDWESINKSLTKKYPKQATEIFTYAKLISYKGDKKHEKFLTNIFPYINKYGNKLSDDELDFLAYGIFEASNNQTHLQKALDWCKPLVSRNNKPGFMNTYANILYRLGRKQEAIDWEKKALAVSDEDSKETLQATLDKMTRNEKTWGN